VHRVPALTWTAARCATRKIESLYFELGNRAMDRNNSREATMRTFRRHSSVIVLLVIAISSGLPRHALSGPKEALTEQDKGEIEFKTLTLTREKFLAGSKTGKEAVISGQLDFPKSEAKVPAVIIFHGGFGISRVDYDWAREIRSIGVGTFVVDSFRGRGINRLPTDDELTPTGQTLDAYRALALLATHPRIDPQRIAVMGRSRGGGLAIFAGVEHVRRAQLPPNVDFAAYLAVYPGLPKNFDFNRWQIRHGRPIRIFQGTADDWTPFAIAQAFVDAQRTKGVDVKMFEYANALHAFDNPDIPTPVRMQGYPGYGGMAGYNPSATAKAEQDVRETLRNIFELK